MPHSAAFVLPSPEHVVPPGLVIHRRTTDILEHRQSALDCRAGPDSIAPSFHVRKIVDIDVLALRGAQPRHDGNIGNGVRDGVEFRGTLPLDDFGLPSTELRLSGIYQHTRIHDPLTGETRAFSSGDNSSPAPRSGSSNGGPPPLSVGNRDWGYVFSLRQDIPEWKSSLTFSVARNADRTEFRRLEDIAISRNDRVDVNWETTAIPGVTLRLGFGNITSPQEIRERTFYIPDRGSGTVLRTERRSNGGGSEGTRSYTIQIAGQF